MFDMITFPPLSCSDSPCCSRLEDVHRHFRSQRQRRPADPAVLLASGHGGDQEPDCGTLTCHSHVGHLLCTLLFAESKNASVIFQKDFRVQELPLARIKKIMKLDEDVKVGGLSDFAWLPVCECLRGWKITVFNLVRVFCVFHSLYLLWES